MGEFIPVLYQALLFFTRLPTGVSVLTPVSTQVFYVTKAETGTQVLPWPVVPLLSLGRQSMEAPFQTGVQLIHLRFVQDVVW